jgi:hypothetical protein
VEVNLLLGNYDGGRKMVPENIVLIDKIEEILKGGEYAF